MLEYAAPLPYPSLKQICCGYLKLNFVDITINNENTLRYYLVDTRFESGESLEFLYFWGHTNKYKEKVGKFCFSQWCPASFNVNGVTYYTAEHWMMAQKALLFGDTDSFNKIILCETPKEAKDLGRNVLFYDDQVWNTKKFELVKLGNIHKFNQHTDYAEFLLNTMEKILVEVSPIDPIWGIGLSADSKDIENIYAWRGQNLLGFVLMEVRDLFREFGYFKPLDNALLPPWLEFPEMDSHNIFWRMGKGEEYLTKFSTYFSLLNEREKQVYKLCFPVFTDWIDFYEFGS